MRSVDHDGLVVLQVAHVLPLDVVRRRPSLRSRAAACVSAESGLAVVAAVVDDDLQRDRRASRSRDTISGSFRS